MDTEKTSKVIKPDFRRAAHRQEQKTGKEQKTKKQLLKEIDKRTKAEKAAEESKNLLHLIFNPSTNFIYLPSDQIDSGINGVLLKGLSAPSTSKAPGASLLARCPACAG